MKKLLMRACLGICALALAACAKERGFSAGTEMSAEELKAYRERLLAQQAEAEQKEEPAAPEAPAEEDELLDVCYYTQNGTVWHADRNCSYLKRSQNVLQGSVEGAAIAGKTRPCSSCAAAYTEE